MSQIIVLAWDALDYELCRRFDVAGSFGRYQSKIQTHINPQIDEPHTRELWPGMITGVGPDTHGIHAVSEDSGVEWDDPKINLLSDIANGLVPQPVLDAIGKRLRERGAALDAKRPRYYRENDLETVFDSGGKAISIPNYETEYDRTHDLDGNRDEVWARILPDRGGVEGFDPAVPIETTYSVLTEEMGKRIGHTTAAIERGYDVVWCWFGLLDTVGHIEPAIDGPIQETAYHWAADATESIKANAPDDATVVSVSDHGLQNGEHTHYATIASDEKGPVRSVNHVFDMAEWINLNRDGSQATDTETDAQAMNQVENQLQELGYIE